MKKLLFTFVVIFVITISLAAQERFSYFSRPSFDPLAQTFGTSNRLDLLSTTLTQNFNVTNQTWENYWKMTAEFNDLNQVTCFTEWYWDGSLEQWFQANRMSDIQYRPDGRPSFAQIQQFYNGAWTTFGDINYHYENDRLMHVRYDCFVNGQSRPYWHLYYKYYPTTNILKMMSEIWFNTNQMPFIRRYEFEWISGNQPVVIDESPMDAFSEWGLIRHTFGYHDLDQTSHASYMRRLEFGWPFYPNMVPGLQPVMLIEQRGFVEDLSGIPERHRYFFEYNDANQLVYKRLYERDTSPAWSQTREFVYEYQDGLQILETYYDTTQGRIDYLPRTRDFKYYTQSSTTNDSLSPETPFGFRIFPNPFNPETTISYKLSASNPVSIAIYNQKGQLVKSLVNEAKRAGDYSTKWNGTDTNGQNVANGVYFVKMTAGSYHTTAKMILMK